MLKWRTCPSLVQVISGGGYAWTSHSNDTMWPSITLTSSSLPPIIRGGTERENNSCVVHVESMSQHVCRHKRTSNNIYYKGPERHILVLLIPWRIEYTEVVVKPFELWTFLTLHCQTEVLLNCSNLVLSYTQIPSHV